MQALKIFIALTVGICSAGSKLEPVCPAGSPQREKYDAHLQKKGIIGVSFIGSLCATFIGYYLTAIITDSMDENSIALLKPWTKNFGRKSVLSVLFLLTNGIIAMANTAILVYPGFFWDSAYTTCEPVKGLVNGSFVGVVGFPFIVINTYAGLVFTFYMLLGRYSDMHSQYFFPEFDVQYNSDENRRIFIGGGIVHAILAVAGSVLYISSSAP
jgi:hypothetical protein